MPARVRDGSALRTPLPAAPAPTTALGRTLRQSQMASTSVRRPIRATQPTKTAATTSDCVSQFRATPAPSRQQHTGGEEDDASLLVALTSASRCKPETVQAMLFTLDVTLGDLSLCLLHRSDDQISRKSASQTLQSSPESGGGALRSHQSASDLARKSDGRAVLFAKQAVNKIIVAFNDLVTSGWKAPNGGRTSLSNSSTPESSRPASVVGALPCHAAAAAAVASRKPSRPIAKVPNGKPPAHTPVKESKTNSISTARATALFDCLRIAIRFLLLKSSPSAGIEIDKIVVSVIRKLIALEMYHAADAELSWVRMERLGAHFTPSTASAKVGSIAVLIPNDVESSDRVALLLDVQALSFVTALYFTTEDNLQDFLHAALNDSDGPFGAQSLVRRMRPGEADIKIVDRSAYTVERAIMRKASYFHDTAATAPSAPSFDDVTFACRAASLRFLLTISDLDMDAFWDRVTRVGVSHFRARSTTTTRQEAFAEVHDVFKQLLEQKDQRDGSTTSTKGLNACIEAWAGLARKAGDVDAMRFIEQSVRGHNVPSSFLCLPKGDADSHIARCCSSIAIADAALELAAAAEERQADELDAILRDARGDFESATSVLGSASSALKTKILKEGNNVRRRCFALLSLKEGGHVWRDTCLQLLIATANLSYTYIVNRTDEDDPTLAEGALNDFVQAKRFAAKVIFDKNTRESHEQSATLLDECDSVLRQASSFGTLTKAKLLQSLASSWQYAGAQLYAQKLAAAAIRFLRCSAELAEQSHALFTAARLAKVEADAQTEEALLQQASNLYKRFEHLGVCYRLTSQPALADAAYRKAVSHVDPLVWTQMESVATGTMQTAASTARDTEARSVADAAHLVKVASEIEAFELMSFSTGHATIFDDIKSREHSAGSLSFLLEHCLASFEDSMHRDEASTACKALLCLLVDSYPTKQFPLRRCRVLLQKLEMNVLQMLSTEEKEETESLVKEIETLLLAPAEPRDMQNERYRAQYKASFALLRTLLTHKADDGGSPAGKARMESYVDDSIANLRTLVQHILPSGDKTESASSDQRTLRAMSAPRQAKERSLSAAAVANPKTPPNRQKIPSALSRAATRERRDEVVVVATNTEYRIQDVKRLLQLMELVQEMEIAHGFILQSIELAEIARDLCIQSGLDDFAKAAYLRCSSALVRQLLALGKEKRVKLTLDEVHAQLDQWGVTNDDACARIYFVQAEYHCAVGELPAAKVAFDKAIGLAEHVDPHTRTSGMQSAMEKALLVERQSIAFCVHAQIHVSGGDGAQGMLSSVNAIKAAMRGGMMLARLTRGAVADDMADTHDSPFSSLNGKKVAEPSLEGNAEARSDKPAPADQRPPHRTYFTSRSLGILYWRMVKALRHAYYRLAWLHTLRGSVRDAEAFTTECVDFAEKAQCSSALASALIERGCLLLRMGKLDAAAEDIERAMAHVEDGKAPKLRAALAFLCGDRCLRLGSLSQAKQHYDNGWSELASVDSALARIRSGRSRGGEIDSGKIITLSIGHRTILQRKAWLTHVMQDEDDEGCLALMEHARQSFSETGEMDVLLGKMDVRKALSELRKDPLLSLATEAAISLPSAATEHPVGEVFAASRTGEIGQVALSHLERSLSRFRDVTDAAATRCTSNVALGEAVVYRMLSQALVANLPLPSTAGFDMAVQHTVRAFTLEQELTDSVHNKINPSRDVAGKVWPRFGSDTTLSDAPTAAKSKRMLAVASHKSLVAKSRAITTDEGSSESEQDSDERAFWQSVRELRGPNSRPPALPRHWTVVSVALSRERNALLITRESRQDFGSNGGAPVVFSIPIDRQMRREGEESTTLGIDEVLGEIREIVEESNTATHAAQHLDGLEARKAWWLRRRELDERLRVQLGAIETTWLGAFKSLLLPASAAACSASSRDALRNALRDTLAAACFPTPSAAAGLQLNACVIDTLCAGLDPAQCTDEDLEDVVHFVMDAYQLQGTPVAIDEVDLDQCVTDVRSVLEAFRSRAVQEDGDKDAEDDAHLFLILDKDLCAVPWESLPCLRGRAVCRVPSMSFLYDRLLMAPDGRFTVKAATAKQYYLINPSQELTRTQERFLPHFQSERSPSLDEALVQQQDGSKPTEHRRARWRGLAGRAPTLDEFGRALETNDVVLYFGHGGAEQFVRASRLRGMLRCAVTMLWGCSSAVLRDMGDFDRTGTPYNYLLAGCPSLVGNLWDATDKELDGVCESTLRRLGMIGHDATEASQSPKRRVSVAQAVAQSRDACKLPYLTGAACVVYGVPVYYDV